MVLDYREVLNQMSLEICNVRRPISSSDATSEIEQLLSPVNTGIHRWAVALKYRALCQTQTMFQVCIQLSGIFYSSLPLGSYHWTFGGKFINPYKKVY